MTIQEFFERSVGRWRSQRSGHHLVALPTGSATGKAQPGLPPSDQRKATLDVQKLTVDDPAVVSLCQSAQPKINRPVNPSVDLSVIYPLSISWEEEGGLSSRNKPKGSTVLALIPDPDNDNFGTVLQAKGQGRYELGTDERLTIWTENELGKLEERFWFASENLRFRLLVQHNTGDNQAKLPLAVFYSEIRLLNPKPAES
ncbi:MAG: phycobiliprotein lyase [Pseudanabaenaceae cyanobacterium]|jgi:phycoerythrin-associated linker protein